jgi:hypothetical protein
MLNIFGETKLYFQFCKNRAMTSVQNSRTVYPWEIIGSRAQNKQNNTKNPRNENLAVWQKPKWVKTMEICRDFKVMNSRCLKYCTGHRDVQNCVVTYKLSTEEIFKAKGWSWLHKNNTLSPPPFSCFAAKINKEYCARNSLCEAHLLPLLNIFWFGVSGTHE